jgi:hypothetical protein
MLWSVIALAAASGLCACDIVDDGDDCSVIAPALINGTALPEVAELTTNERHAIVAIEDSAGALRCTGTVVDDLRVLTAAQCLGDGHIVARFYSGELIPLEVVVAQSEGVVLLENTSRALPDGVTPLPLWRDDITRNWVGHTATLAGFGITETQELGKLRFLDEPITDVTASTIEVDGMGSHGACAGDLGAPLIMGNGAKSSVAGVLVSVSASCTGVDGYRRIDDIVQELERLYGNDAGPYSDLGGC